MDSSTAYERMHNSAALTRCSTIFNLFLFWHCICLVYIECVAELQIPKFDESGSIDLSYKGELDNLNISKIYNSSSGQIQYVLNVEHPVKVDVKVIQLSPCDAKDYPLPPDVVIGELYIPSISDNFSLSDNCSYQIEVKANRHVLDIIYYIPDVSPINVDAANANVVREDRILFMQPFYNKDIDRIQYKIKWQDSVNDYSINIFPEGDHEHCKSNSPYSVQENATELLIPHLSSNFELRGNCKYVIQTTIDDQVRNITSYISGNLKVECMFLERIYNETINKIQYILRWPDVAPDEYKVDIINAESSASYCKKNFQGDFNSSNVEVHIPPTRNYDFSLNGNCKYIIEVRYDDKKTQIINDIPECIGPLCNCEILGPHPQEQLSIEREDAYFNISWLFPNNKTNNITNYGFYLFDNEDCNSSGKRRKLNPTKLSNNFALINVKHVMDGNCLSVSFNNSYHCPYSVVFLKLKEIQPTKLNSGSSWIFVLAATILFTLLLVIVIYYFKLSRRKCFQISNTTTQSTQPSRLQFSGRPGKQEECLLYIPQEILDGKTDNYEFPRNRIELVKVIGKGAFGEVLLAKALICGSKRHVAVKRLREHPPSEEREDFLSEIDILKKIGYHQNIVKLIGCCTLQEPNMMIMEYVPCGDLKQYLLDLRNQWQNLKKSVSDYSVFTSRSSAYIVPDTPDSPITLGSKMSATTECMNMSSIDSPRSDINTFDFEIEKVLDHKELQSFALQIAKGMEHLERIPITHRDLAARNILISSEKVLKISDFGLSRKGPYINNKTKKLPLRWMAIESIEDHFYDNKSDVWSFAVVLWEIATLGAFPYQKIPDSMMLYYLQNGKRLSRPEICTDELYNLMLRCWSRDKNTRPSFSELVDLLDVKARRVYVDFSQLNPTYVFPPISNSDRSAEVKFSTTIETAPKYLEFT